MADAVDSNPASGTLDEAFRELDHLWAKRDPAHSASDSVHRTLREGIITGVLAPGMRLGEEDLARHLQVSRTPVREAVLRLEAERLAERAARRGLVVAAVSHQEILELYVVRAAVDGLAARLAAEGASASDITALKWINARMRDASRDRAWSDMAQLNLDFHETLGRAGHNDVLLDLLHGIHDRVRRFPGTTFSEGSRSSEALTEHDGIIEAVESRDPATAEHLATAHMRSAMETRVAMLVQGELGGGGRVARRA
jgi:DNA-binding GntR family transcriptional regulator